MTLTTPTFLDSPSLLTSDDVLVVGLRKTETGCQVHAPGLGDEEIEALTTLAKAVDAEGGIDSHWRQAAPVGLDVKSVLFTGLGDRDVTADHLREAAGFAALQLSVTSRVVFALADSGDL
jgi:leucyl aminopeptidase